MSVFRAVLTAIALSFLPASALAEDDARLAAVLSYADWCASCQVLDPKLEEVRANAPIEGVRYVTLDYTDRVAEDYFAQADDAGVGDVVRAHFANGVRTGMLLLIDIDDGQIVGQVRRGDTVSDITAALRAAAAGA